MKNKAFSWVDDLVFISSLAGPSSVEDKQATVLDVVSAINEGFAEKPSLLRQTVGADNR